MKSQELKWGLLIAGASALWLYGGACAGLHSRSLAWVQGLTWGGFALVFAGYFLAFRDLFRSEPELTLREALRSGLTVAGVVAAAAPLVQWGYLAVVHPGWTEFLAGEIRARYLAAGLAQDEAEALAEEAKSSFSTGAYLLQATLGALYVGALSTLVLALGFCRRQRRAR